MWPRLRGALPGAGGRAPRARRAAALGGGLALGAWLRGRGAACEGREAEEELPWAWASDQCALWRREWQADWDGRAPPPGARRESREGEGRERHLLFVRHGQYDLESEEQGLTELGAAQTRLLAERLAKMSGSLFKDRNNEYRVRFAGIWSSDAPRARQTAEILAEHLPDVPLQPPDAVLAEGKPAVPCPQKRRGGVRASALWEDSARIELAFRRYVHRDVDQKSPEAKEAKEAEAEQPPEPQQGAAQASEGAPRRARQPERVFEIVVCHCNVIRYFTMRSLQLPPEAWLRLGGFNTGITEICIRPNGSVTLVRFGDTGHLPIEMTTFH